MALCYTRLLCRRGLGINSFRGLYTSKLIEIGDMEHLLLKAIHIDQSTRQSTLTLPAVTSALQTATKMCETHDEKNMRLKRPMSPHLTIYQVQLTALLSISHRATGMLLSSYAAIFGLGTLTVPGGIPCLIETVDSLCLPAAVLLVGKLALAFPATFHFWNGIRHLAWDLGFFLTIKEVYSTGYTMVLMAALSAIALAAL